MFHVDLELDSIIAYAYQEKISDIHFDRQEKGLLVRLRQDGVLVIYKFFEFADGDKIVNRIKVLSGLNIGEKRLPQDGRWDWRDKENNITMRVSTLPTIEGETIVCRILGNVGAQKSLAELGMDTFLVANMNELIHRPHGLTLICGPTGSGKTATLYAVLNELNLVEENIITLENPVEAKIPGSIQVQVNDKIGFTFANGLRSILRQDPDTIIVGEIRDGETARLAIEAALTGHKVFSTIHTNRAIEVIERLMNMGIEKYLIEAVLNGVISQRLVRRYENERLSKGRIALFELLLIPRERPNWKQIDSFLVKTLAESATEAYHKGITTDKELQRIGIYL